MRLIDADALIEEIANMDISEQSKIFSVNMLRTAPTAYNLDAVVEQLECNRDEFDRRGIVPLVNMDYAVDIVRNGGKE